MLTPSHCAVHHSKRGRGGGVNIFITMTIIIITILITTVISFFIPYIFPCMSIVLGFLTQLSSVPSSTLIRTKTTPHFTLPSNCSKGVSKKFRMKASVFEANSFRGIRKTEEVGNVGIIQILLLQPALPLKEVKAGCRFFLSYCSQQ